MKIFYFFKELDTPMYQWQRTNLIDELIRNNHDVFTFNPLDYRTIEEANEIVVNKIKDLGRVDLFMACDDQDTIYKETVESISKLGIPTCLICWDNLELPYKQKKIAPAFDIVWLTSWETQYLFEKWGCKKVIFQTYAANPYTYKAQTLDNQIHAVGFIGSPYGSRTNKINDLLANEVKCALYSNALFNKGYNTSIGGKKKLNVMDVLMKASRYMRFPIGRKVFYSTIKNKIQAKSVLNTDSKFVSLNHSVSHEEMCRLYSALSLSLNISELRDTYILKHPIPKIHLRTFEIPMCGGLQFTSYNEEIAQYFEDGKEIVLYRTKEEMIDKAKFYLDEKNSSLVQNMKMAARKRAEKEHTWTIRFNNIFKLLSMMTLVV